MILVSSVKIVKQRAFVLLPVLMAAMLLAWFFLEVSNNRHLSAYIALHNKNQQRAFVQAQQALNYAQAHLLANCFVQESNWQEDTFWQQLSEQCSEQEGGLFAIENYQEEGSEEYEAEIFYRISSLGKVRGEKVILQTIKRPRSGGRLSWRRLI
jgi:hypothetical protein